MIRLSEYQLIRHKNNENTHKDKIRNTKHNIASSEPSKTNLLV
jgi:hypothetical protein